MLESVLPRFALAAVGALGSVIDDAHRRARRRRVLWGATALAALALGLTVFLAISNGGTGSGKATPSGSGGAPGRQARPGSERHFSSRPIFVFGGITRPPGGAQLKDKHRLLAQPTAVGSAVIWIAPDWAVRGTCAWLTVGHAVYGGECRRFQPSRHGLSEVVPLSLRIKGHLLNLLWGQVGDDVASLDLRFQDSRVTSLPLTKRFFFYLVPSRRRRVGHRPTWLIARDKSGRTLGARLEFSLGGGRVLRPH